MAVEEFPKNGKDKEGNQVYKARCYDCRNLMRREQYAKDPTKVLQQNRSWYEANKDKTLNMTRRWRKENADKKREADARWREKNREKAREANRRYEASLKGKSAKKRSTANRRAILREAGVLPKGFWEALLRVYGSKCMKPGCESAERLTPDHIVPLAKGGRNELYNLQILCGSCNSAKQARSADDFRDWPRLVDTKC
ncbi:HNH endonuclease [Streptomyces werraensis]|uniref:HNH endonuclease n=1 Tax=Streptomyces werraensis TaxID=68284 RepID=UPI0037F9403B